MFIPLDSLPSKYRPIALIGEGAFGRVYRVEHLGLKAERALKVLRRDEAGVGPTIFAEMQARFQLEAQLGARLDHPHIVRVHDFEQEGETLILVMECCSGGSLASRLAEMRRNGQPMNILEALRLGLEIAQGLSALHALDIVHRDLKPSNLLFGADGRLKIGDLGLAQAPGGLSQRSRLGSLAGPQPGTPAYMSPEQVEHAAHLSLASDVYALGLILFEMLSGRGYNLRPGTRLSELRPDAAWLDKLLAKMLAENPKERPRDGSEVGRLLRLALEAEQSRLDVKAAAVRAAAQKAAEEKAAVKAAVQRTATANGVQDANRMPFKIPAKRPALKFQPAAWGLLAAGALAAIAAIVGILWWYGTSTGTASRNMSASQTLAALAAPTATAAPFVTPELSASPTPILPTPTALPDTASESAQPPAQAKAGDSWRRPSDGMEMVYIPAGEFLTGSADTDSQADGDEKPQHTVYLDDFWIDRTEVTNAMYALCVQVGVCQPPGDESSRKRDEYYSNLQYADYPVIYVSWDDAQTYCAWAGGRLPTEAEWEKAARGEDGRIYPWGNAVPDCTLLNYNNCKGDTTAVGSYPAGASPYGLFDMSGNVWEWVQDWYDAGYYVASPYGNPPGPGSGSSRVLRGGSWYNEARIVRAAYRNRNVPGRRLDDIGFRCAR